MLSLSVVIITRNEQANLPRCLASVSWADEIIVIDSGSTDDTREIAWEAGATVHEIEFRGYGPTKAFGVSKATSSWVLSLDADEEVSPELADEIRDLLAAGTNHRGFDMPRLTRFLGRWIKHCGWYPDRVLRLFERNHGGIDDAQVHEAVVVEGTVGHFENDLLHHSYPTIEHYFAKSNRYTTLGAEVAFREGRRAGLSHIVLRPLTSFLSHYFVRQGFRDGLEGFLISVFSAIAVMTKYAKLRAMYHDNETHSGKGA
jgi:glycosyltransferase involved in cell wall biosynthesis